MTRRPFSIFLAIGVSGLLISQLGGASAVVPARDPGVRAGGADAGRPLEGLTAAQTEYFDAGLADFKEVETVADGLGPRMNLDNCAGCHYQPAVGGSSPAINPQIAFANKDGGADVAPSFITLNGPVREARFVQQRDGTPDGGVHSLFTIAGRHGAEGCSIAQPDFEAQLDRRNVIFRIPTPLFGAGLIEQIPDAAILANQASHRTMKSALGVRGRPNFNMSGRTITGEANRNGNDGTIARFGWKAQNKSLLIFSGEAYNVEMGISNELFPTERDETPRCQMAKVPNDTTNLEAQTTVGLLSGVEKFAHFMRLLAPPAASSTIPGGVPSIRSGRATFEAIGCALCHTPALKTGNASIEAMRRQAVNLFSDLMLHDMGMGLADGVSQGEAGPREFRTAPLWGLGQRIFFLHDGRTSNLLTAIRAHGSAGSEGSGSVSNFMTLTEEQKQDLLNFLRSL